VNYLTPFEPRKLAAFERLFHARVVEWGLMWFHMLIAMIMAVCGIHPRQIEARRKAKAHKKAMESKTPGPKISN
jgi:hypothetical protein